MRAIRSEAVNPLLWRPRQEHPMTALRLQPRQFYGEILRSREVGGLSLTETGYVGDTRLPKHSHANPYICLVRHGTYREQYDGKWRVCEPLTLVYHPADEVHSETFLAGQTRSFNIELESS